MIKSMTGYGRAQTSIDDCDITVELRSVNHRYHDCMVRIPRIYVSMEEHIKARVQREVSRGKVDVFVTIEHKEGSNIEIKYNPEVAKAYVAALEDMSETLNLKNNIDLMWLSRMPEVFTTSTKETDNDILLEGVLTALDDALEELNAMRMREGENLKNDILSHASTIEANVYEVERVAKKALPEYREKLLQKMEEVLGDAEIDENRILLEAAIYSDRVGVDEELVRLRSHIGQLRNMLEKGGPIGRKLDFLLQEFNREINTVGSKANDIEIAGFVVEIKSEIEKIREQIQNIE